MDTTWKTLSVVLLAALALVFVVLYATNLSAGKNNNNVRFVSRTDVGNITEAVVMTVLVQTDGNSTGRKTTWPLDPATTTLENLRMYVTDNPTFEPIPDLGTYLTDGNDTRIREAFNAETVVSPTAEDVLGLTSKYHATFSVNGSINTTKTLQVYGRVKTNDGSYLLVHTSMALSNPVNGVWVNVSSGYLTVYTPDLELPVDHPESLGVVFTSIH